jgi:hypothetical protein
MACEDDIGEIAPLDFADEVVDGVSKREPGGRPVIRQPGESRRDDPVAAVGEQPGYRLPTPAS